MGGGDGVGVPLPVREAEGGSEEDEEGETVGEEEGDVEGVAVGERVFEGDELGSGHKAATMALPAAPAEDAVPALTYVVVPAETPSAALTNDEPPPPPGGVPVHPQQPPPPPK